MIGSQGRKFVIHVARCPEYKWTRAQVRFVDPIKDEIAVSVFVYLHTVYKNVGFFCLFDLHCNVR